MSQTTINEELLHHQGAKAPLRGVGGAILVTGANGQLGRSLQHIAHLYPNAKFHFLGREHFPIHHPQIAEQIFEALKPTICINAAAYTAVDKAEAEKELALLYNATAPYNLAALCKKYHTKFIHISTDYVFNGKSTSPLKETDTVNPVNYYGETKLEGEKLVMSENPVSIIIRTSWVYAPWGHNFVKTMMRLMAEKDSISVVNDQLGSPTYAIDLAEVIMKIAQAESAPGGIYHYSNDGEISWYQFAEEIKKIGGYSCTVNPIETYQFPTPAARPAYSVMDKTKICDTFGVVVKDWKESLRVCIEQINNF